MDLELVGEKGRERDIASERPRGIDPARGRNSSCERENEREIEIEQASERKGASE